MPMLYAILVAYSSFFYGRRRPELLGLLPQRQRILQLGVFNDQRERKNKYVFGGHAKPDLPMLYDTVETAGSVHRTITGQDDQ